MSHVYSKLVPFYDVATCTYLYFNVRVNSVESQCERTLSKEKIRYISLHDCDERCRRLLLTMQLKIALFSRSKIVNRVIWTSYIYLSLAQKQMNGFRLNFRRTSWKSIEFSNCAQSEPSSVVLIEPNERPPLPEKVFRSILPSYSSVQIFTTYHPVTFPCSS
jgi:hypothetical protein